MFKVMITSCDVTWDDPIYGNRSPEIKITLGLRGIFGQPDDTFGNLTEGELTFSVSSSHAANDLMDMARNGQYMYLTLE